MEKRKPNKSVVIGTIGEDAHIIGGWVLMHTFRQAGFTVAFLGAMVPQQDFINAAIEINADAILVSSSYGMGLIDCEGLRDKCVEAGLSDIILYAGGSVAPSMELENNWDEVERRFQAMGFNRVFKNTIGAKEAAEILKNDLGLE
jgi:methylaspartate mutase sigma subunit